MSKDVGTENLVDDSSKDKGSTAMFQGDCNYNNSSVDNSPLRSPLPFLIEEQTYSQIVNPVIISSTRVRKASPKPKSPNSDILQIEKKLTDELNRTRRIPSKI